MSDVREDYEKNQLGYALCRAVVELDAVKRERDAILALIISEADKYADEDLGNGSKWSEMRSHQATALYDLYYKLKDLKRERDEAREEKIHRDNFLSAEAERVEMAKMLRSEREAPTRR